MLRLRYLVEEVGRCEGCGQVITIHSGYQEGTPPDEVNAAILELFSGTPQHCPTCGQQLTPLSFGFTKESASWKRTSWLDAKRVSTTERPFTDFFVGPLSATNP